jgi:hypothetical protein
LLCLAGRKRKTGLHDRRPLLEAIGIDLAQHLDVHQRIADLDVVAGAGEQVDLVAFLDAIRIKLRQPPLRLAEALAK